MDPKGAVARVAHAALIGYFPGQEDTMIRDAQTKLAALGFDPGPIDGLDGKKTRAAVTAFQASVGLPQDGKVTSELLMALNGSKPIVPRVTATGGPIPADWLSQCQMRAIVLHWSAGGNKPSAVDRQHYHVIVGGDCQVVRGDHEIRDNVNTADDDYAAHTRGFNTGTIGLALAGMLDAQESGNYGPQPINEKQWIKAAECAAQLARFYKIPVTDKTILSHAEVQPNLGIAQKGKWDVTRLPWDPSVKGAKACGDRFRALVRSFLA